MMLDIGIVALLTVATWNRWGCNPQGGGQGFVLWPFREPFVRQFSGRCVVGVRDRRDGSTE